MGKKRNNTEILHLLIKKILFFYSCMIISETIERIGAIDNPKK